MSETNLDNEQTRNLVDGVPRFDRFKFIDELEQASRELAKKHPDVVELREIGRSSEGKPINTLLIGEGDCSVFLYGFTHPNEPIGSLTIEYLASRLAAGADMRKQFGCKFILAKAIDVDGARLNEGWFRGPFDLLTYAENYYRPPPNEQAEWTFPIDYKTLHWNTPIPETTAIKRIVDEFKPEFTYILHNADFCGVYYYLSHALQSAYPELKKIPLAEGLPLHKGEPPDELYLETLDEGIYHDYGVTDEYEFLLKTVGGDPATEIDYGTDCYEYIRNMYGGFSLTCELPYFYDERIQDANLTPFKRRDLLVGGMRIEAATQELIKEVLDRCDELLNANSRIYRSVRYLLDRWTCVQKTTQLHSKDPAFNRPSTVAETFDLTVLKTFSQMPALGMVQRLLKEAEKRTQDRKLTGLRDEVHSRLLQLNNSILHECVPKTIPIKKLVRIQLKSALVSLRHLDFDSPGEMSRQQD